MTIGGSTKPMRPQTPSEKKQEHHPRLIIPRRPQKLDRIGSQTLSRNQEDTYHQQTVTQTLLYGLSLDATKVLIENDLKASYTLRVLTAEFFLPVKG